MAIQTTRDLEQTMSSARDAYLIELHKMAEEGIVFALAISDNIPPAPPTGQLLLDYPERCFNFGIAEGNEIGAAAGLAKSGLTVFAQAFGPFLSLRAADQIHTDIAFNNVNVRLIGTHCGISSNSGPSHNAIADLALFRAIPNLTICAPADAGQMCKLVRQSMDYAGPMTIRIDRAGTPDVYASQDYDFEIGKAIEIQPGTDATIVATGSRVYYALMASKLLEENNGMSVRVIDMHTIKPLDTAMLDKCASETGCILTAEDHSLNGGLGGAVAEYLLEGGFTGKFKRIALPDEFAKVGKGLEAYTYYRLDEKGIAEQVLELLERS